MKQLSVFRRAAMLDLAAAQQDPETADRWRDLSRKMSDAMRIDAECPAQVVSLNL